jgi:hypothetical protein
MPGRPRPVTHRRRVPCSDSPERHAHQRLPTPRLPVPGHPPQPGHPPALDQSLVTQPARWHSPQHGAHRPTPAAVAWNQAHRTGLLVEQHPLHAQHVGGPVPCIVPQARGHTHHIHGPLDQPPLTGPIALRTAVTIPIAAPRPGPPCRCIQGRVEHPAPEFRLERVGARLFAAEQPAPVGCKWRHGLPSVGPMPWRVQGEGLAVDPATRHLEWVAGAGLALPPVVVAHAALGVALDEVRATHRHLRPQPAGLIRQVGGDHEGTCVQGVDGITSKVFGRAGVDSGLCWPSRSCCWGPRSCRAVGLLLPCQVPDRRVVRA